MQALKPSTRTPYSRLQCHSSRILRGSHRQGQQLTDHSRSICNSSYPEDYLLKTGHRNRTLVLCVLPCVSKGCAYSGRSFRSSLFNLEIEIRIIRIADSQGYARSLDL